jgi:ankyrin repeat protein
VAACRHADTVAALLASNVDPDATDCLGRTALIQAAAQGHDDVVCLLMTARADVNYSPTMDGRTALNRAANHSHLKCCKLLQGYGADVLCIDNYGCSPCELAGSDFFLISKADPICLYELVDEGDPSEYNFYLPDSNARLSDIEFESNQLEVAKQTRRRSTVVENKKKN